MLPYRRIIKTSDPITNSLTFSSREDVQSTIILHSTDQSDAGIWASETAGAAIRASFVDRRIIIAASLSRSDIFLRVEFLGASRCRCWRAGPWPRRSPSSAWDRPTRSMWFRTRANSSCPRSILSTTVQYGDGRSGAFARCAVDAATARSIDWCPSTVFAASHKFNHFVYHTRLTAGSQLPDAFAHAYPLRVTYIAPF